MRRILVLFLSVAISVVAFAGKVTEQQALQKAQQFLKGKSLTKVKTRSLSRGSSSSDEAFYIFNAENKGGFVIVSGDDSADMILGYADKGEFSAEQMPVNIRTWLESYAKQIDLISQSSVSARSPRLTRTSKAAIPYLIQTQWDQWQPYNLRCPQIDGEYPVTGCVATAMAQVMYYHKCPKTSTAIPAYNTYTKGISVPELPATTFKWDQMQLTYNGSETGASADAVAELMRYCGQAVEMDYTLNSSGAAIFPNAMINYFGYSVNTRYVNRSEYTLEEWEDLIYTELLEGRPVLYSGSNLTGGHQFICDGYDGNGYFHINWGWSGYSDGWFLLSVANPSGKGAGGGASEDGYCVGQDAIIGLKPAVAGEVATPYIQSGMYDLENKSYTRSSESSDFTNVEFPGFVNIYYEAGSGPDFPLEFGWGLFKDGQLLKVLGSSSTVFTNDENWAYNGVLASFGSDLSDGVYRAIQLYRRSSTDDWQAIQDSKLHFVEVVISGNTLTLERIQAYDIEKADITVNSVTFSDRKVVGRPVEITVNLTNNGYTNQEPLFFSIGGECFSQVSGSVEPGKTGDVLMHFTPKYSMNDVEVTISTDYFLNNVVWTGTLTITEPLPYNLSGSSFSVEGMKDYVLSGTTLKFSATIKNESSDTYDDDLILCLWKSTEPMTSGGSFMMTTFATAEQPVKIGPGESKQVAFSIPNLVDGGYGYWIDLLYYSEGTNVAFDLGDLGYAFTVVKDDSGDDPDSDDDPVPDDPIPAEEAITISGALQVPYYSEYNLDFTDKPELKAYVATGYDKSTGVIWLTRVKQVPAETGFLLMGDPGDYDIPTIDGVSDVYYKNMFKGTLEGTTLYTTDGDYTNYYLSKGDAGVGFYKVTKEDGVKVGANRCYLPILTEIPANGSTGDTEMIKVSAAKQVPYYTSKNLDFSSLDAQGVKAYTATGYNYHTGVIWLTRVKKVPAQTGILVMADVEGDYNVPTTTVQSVYENMFVGSETAQTIYTNEEIGGVDYVNYYLSKGDAGVGFYKVTNEDGVKMGANRCYLPIPKRDAASGARGKSGESSLCKMVPLDESNDDVIAIPIFGGMNGEDDGTTGIDIQSSIFNLQSNEVYYNLQGQRVENPRKGIYIHNGRRVVIK